MAGLSPWVTVAWDQVRDPPLTADEYAEETGFKKFNHKNTFIETRHLVFTWNSQGRYIAVHKEHFQPTGTEKIIPRFNLTDTFDGKIFYELGANPGEGHCLTRCDFENEEDADIEDDYFNWIGFPLPDDSDSLKYHVPTKPAIVSLLDDGGAKLTAVENLTLNGTPVVRLTLERAANSPEVYPDEDYHFPLDAQVRQYFYLDPRCDWAIIRHDNMDKNGALTFRANCSDFKRIARRGLFLPRTIEVTHVDPMAAETVHWTLKVDRIDFNAAADGAFVLSDHQKGTWVYDLFGSKKELRVVQADGTLKKRKFVPEEAVGMP